LKKIFTGFLPSFIVLYCLFALPDLNAQNESYSDRQNMAAIAFTYDRYGNDIADWERMHVEYRRFTERGPIIGRLNIGHRFGITDYQGELDIWPVFSENWYGYANIGISGGDLFPGFRAGAELYRVLPNGFETSAGFRYLNFSEDDVLIFTGSLSKYLGNWLLIARPFLTPQDGDVSASINLIARRYFGKPENFASLIGGIGFSPDEQRLLDGNAEERLLMSRYVGIVGNYLVQNRFELFGELKLTGQQFPFTDDYVSIYTLEAGARYRF
jgi:YaiO family outer membrane protein